MMLETLHDTGSPVVNDVLKSRKSYYTHLFIALAATTVVVLLWAVMATPQAKIDPCSSDTVKSGTEAKLLINLKIATLRAPAGQNLAESAPNVESTDTARTVQGRQERNISEPPEPNLLSPSDSILHFVYLDLGYQDKSIKFALSQVCARLGWLTTYPENLVQQHISIPAKRRTVHELLTEILQPAGLTYWKGAGRMVSVYRDLSKNPA